MGVLIAAIRDYKCKQSSTGKSEGKRTVERSKRRWEDNTEYVRVDWIHLVLCTNHRESLVNAAVNIRVPSRKGSF
jgi:hypothetical protein